MKNLIQYSTTMKALGEVVKYLENKYGNFEYAEKPRTEGNKTTILAKVNDQLISVEIDNQTGKWHYEEL